MKFVEIEVLFLVRVIIVEMIYLIVIYGIKYGFKLVINNSLFLKMLI